MTEEGFLKAEEFFERHFVKETKTVPFPKLTPPAKKRWEQIPEQIRKDILESVWCSQCRTTVGLQLREGQMSGRSLVLRGTCKKCGSEAARVVEPVEK
jgi:RNase P subunit RPR2